MLDFLNNIIFLDFAKRWQLGFQDPASPVMEGLIDLHHHIFFFLIIIIIFVVWMLIVSLINSYFFPYSVLGEDFSNNNVLNQEDLNYYKENRIKFIFKSLKTLKITHNYLLEIVWTLVPAYVLILIAIPSFALLYSMDEVLNTSLTLKVIGHQWYWSYQYSDYVSIVNKHISFDSFMLQEDDLEEGQLRLLEVDNFIILPTNINIRVIVVAADVLHSWAVPSLGLKIDAVPGRLNQIFLYIKREGIFYGQCSEICGAYHGFMPIVVQSVDLKTYVDWINNNLN